MTMPPRPDTPRRGPSRRTWIIGGVLVVIVVILAISQGAEPDTPVPGDETAVDWENYAPAVKERIDAMAVEGDCAGLQAEFGVAAANDDAQRDRVGKGNADLMGYIDDKLREAGCYG